MLPVRPPWLSPRALLGGALATLAALSGPGSGPVRGEDAAKPDPPGVEAATRVQAADETAYAEEPYWYRPGHPLRPAEAKDIETRPGFVAEKLLTVPPELGSWIALTVDDKGVQLAEASRIKQEVEPLTGGHFALLVLLGNAIIAAAHAAQRAQLV